YDAVGDTIASGPGRALFAISICEVAHPEFTGPITPMTASAAAYVFAFEAHFSGVYDPSATVASSQAWYATLKRPARKWCRRRTNSIACTIANVTGASKLCVGRSDTISASGRPDPA